MINVKSRVPQAASESLDAASSFVDQLMHDKTLRRKLRAAINASAAASRRAQTQTRRRGISSLVTDPVLKGHLVDALSQLQAVRKAGKTPNHRARNRVALIAGAGAMMVAILKLGQKLTDKTEDA